MSGTTHTHFRELENAIDSIVNGHRVLLEPLSVQELQTAVLTAVRSVLARPVAVNDQAILDFLLAISNTKCFESCCEGYGGYIYGGYIY